MSEVPDSEPIGITEEEQEELQVLAERMHQLKNEMEDNTWKGQFGMISKLKPKQQLHVLRKLLPRGSETASTQIKAAAEEDLEAIRSDAASTIKNISDYALKQFAEAMKITDLALAKTELLKRMGGKATS